MTTLGIKEGFKEGEREKEKEQVRKEKDKEKESAKEKVALQKMRAVGLRMNGKEMRQRTGMDVFGPVKMKQRGNPKAGMNGKEITMMSMDTSKDKERKVRKGKGKKKVMGLNIKEKWTR